MRERRTRGRRRKVRKRETDEATDRHGGKIRGKKCFGNGTRQGEEVGTSKEV